MATRSELLYRGLFLLLALTARSVAMTLSASLLRDAMSMLSVVMPIGDVIVAIGRLHRVRSWSERR